MYVLLTAYSNNVLGITDGLHDLGGIQWQLALCLLAAWLGVFACLVKGVKSSGKVSKNLSSNAVIALHA